MHFTLFSALKQVLRCGVFIHRHLLNIDTHILMIFSKLDFLLILITFSDWILGLSGQDFGWFIASLDTGNLLEESTIHTSCLGVHKSAKFVLVPVLHFRSLRYLRTGTWITHLILQVLLVSQ